MCFFGTRKIFFSLTEIIGISMRISRPIIETSAAYWIYWWICCRRIRRVCIDMPGEKKFKNFSEFLVEYMKFCQKHSIFSEATLKLWHVMSYRAKCSGRGDDFSTRPPEHRSPIKFDDQRPFRSENQVPSGGNNLMIEIVCRLLLKARFFCVVYLLFPEYVLKPSEPVIAKKSN